MFSIYHDILPFSNKAEQQSIDLSGRASVRAADVISVSLIRMNSEIMNQRTLTREIGSVEVGTRSGCLSLAFLVLGSRILRYAEEITSELPHRGREPLKVIAD
jgi:hypothetical protein